jgi:type II secretory pathway component PulF
LASYAYKGVDSAGASVRGTVDAIDRRVAVKELAASGHFVTEILSSSGGLTAAAAGDKSLSVGSVFSFGTGRVKGKDVLAVTTQLSTALKAGLPILKAIEIIAAQQQKPAMKKILDELASAVRSGESLSDAMAKHPHAFNDLYVSMVRVGETGGILEKTMEQLTGLLAREDKIKSNMKNAAAYPIFVLGIGVPCVLVMITAILPKIIDTIGGGVTALPLPTKMLLGLSGFLAKFGWALLLAMAVGGYFFVKWKNTKAGRVQWDSFVLRIPLLGTVMRAIAVGRFARTLGALSASGITILEALAVVRGTLGNEMLSVEIDKVAEKVKVGQCLADPLSESGLFPPLLIQIVSIGEQTGRFDELLLNAADTFDEQADSAITRFMAIFPSLLIVSLAVLIGFVIIATLLPVMSMDLGGVGV